MQLDLLVLFCRKIYSLSKIGDIIRNRKETILKNLQDAESKFREAEENLAFAKKNFEMAKNKADQIRQQGSTLSSQTAKTLLEAVDEDIKRLKSVNLSTIRMEEEKSINELCQKLSLFAFEKAVDTLNKRLNPSLHKRIISQNIDKLSLKTLASR